MCGFLFSVRNFPLSPWGPSLFPPSGLASVLGAVFSFFPSSWGLFRVFSVRHASILASSFGSPPFGLVALLFPFFLLERRYLCVTHQDALFPPGYGLKASVAFQVRLLGLMDVFPLISEIPSFPHVFLVGTCTRLSHFPSRNYLGSRSPTPCLYVSAFPLCVFIPPRRIRIGSCL